MAQILLLSHTLNGTIGQVYDCLLDFQKFGKCHPFMRDTTVIKVNPPNWIEYAVKEEILLLGFLKIRPEYRAEVTAVAQDKQIKYFSKAKGGIVLTIHFLLLDQGNGVVQVNENIEVKGNPLLNKYFLNILRKAHLKTFENIQTMLLVNRKANVK